MNWFKKLFDAEPPPPPIPTDPAEAHRQAITQFKLALAYFKDAAQEKDSDTIIPLLGKAASALEKARHLDPTVQLDGKTHDGLAAAILYYEALLKWKQADVIADQYADVALSTFGDKAVAKRYRKGIKDALAQAEQAALKAINYQPQDADNTFILAKIYRSQDRKPEARATAQKALALSPDDIDILKFIDGL